jgi:hypothetical protein
VKEKERKAHVLIRILVLIGATLLLGGWGSCSYSTAGYPQTAYPAPQPAYYPQPVYAPAPPPPQMVYAPAPYYSAPVYYQAYAPTPPAGYVSVSIDLGGRRGWQHVPYGYRYWDGHRHYDAPRPRRR